MIRNLQGLIRTTAATMLLVPVSRGEYLEGLTRAWIPVIQQGTLLVSLTPLLTSCCSDFFADQGTTCEPGANFATSPT